MSEGIWSLIWRFYVWVGEPDGFENMKAFFYFVFSTGFGILKAFVVLVCRLGVWLKAFGVLVN